MQLSLTGGALREPATMSRVKEANPLLKLLHSILHHKIYFYN